jgi:tetratricopeptide (TPR) repeat protein
MQHKNKHKGKIASEQDIARVIQNAMHCQRLGMLSQASDLWAGVLKASPNHAGALKALAELSTNTGQHTKAVSFWKRLAVLHSNVAAVHNQLGLALVNDTRLDEAIASYRRAAEIDQNMAVVHYNLGMALIRKADYGAATSSFSRAIELNHTNANYYFQLCNATLLNEKPLDSIVFFNKALALNKDPSYYYNRAKAEAQMGDHNSAVSSLNKAVDLQPDFADALYNLGNAYSKLNELVLAIQSYDRAILVDPTYADAHFRKGIALSLQGNLSDAWPLFEWRWKLKTERVRSKAISTAMWNGTDSLKGKSILIHGEQGFGDTIQFSRYIPEICALGAKVYVEEEASILPLLQTSGAKFEGILRGETLPATDYHCPLLSCHLSLKQLLKPSHAQINIFTVTRHDWKNGRLKWGGKIAPELGWHGVGTQGT